MIRYTLKCAADHGFDSWFQSAAAYDSLAAAGHLACPVCGAASVEKALMAPGVAQAPKAPGNAARVEAARDERLQSEGALSQPHSEMEKAMADLRRKVEANSEYVGVNFVAEARKMHEGTAPERSIYGEAKPEEAIKLLEEGVRVAPLPFMPARKTN